MAWFFPDRPDHSTESEPMIWYLMFDAMHPIPYLRQRNPNGMPSSSSD
jgi:hypothetical protein